MFWALAGGLLSGASSLIGGLGARSSAKSQQRRQEAYDLADKQYNQLIGSEMMRQVPQRIAGDAELAGFNPVTWLNGGALGFYSNAFGMMRSSGPTQAVNVPSVGSAVGDALSSFTSAFSKQINVDNSMALQSSMLDRQLSAIGGSKASRPSSSTSLGTSALGGAGGAYIAAGSALSGGAGGLSLATPFNTFGWKGVEQTQVYEGIRPSGKTPDAEKAATRYGELVGDTQGLVNFLGDLTNSDGKGTWWDTLRRGMNYQPFGGAAPGSWRDLKNPFRNPNTPPGYSTGGGFGGGELRIPYVTTPWGTAGGF